MHEKIIPFAADRKPPRSRAIASHGDLVNDMEVGDLQQLNAQAATAPHPREPLSTEQAATTAARPLPPPLLGQQLTDAIRIERPLRVAVITALQAVIPAIVAAACLFALGKLYGYPLEPTSPPVVTMVVLCLILVHIPAQVTSQLTASRIPAALGMIGRWVLLVIALSALAGMTGFLGDAPTLKQIALVWTVTTPLVLVVVSILMHEVTRLFLMRATQVRNVVFAGYNENSLALAQRLAGNKHLNLRVTGFFDDRSSSRLGVDGDAELVGKLADMPDFVRRQSIDVIFISLPIRHIKRVVDLVDELHDTTCSVYYLPDLYAFDLIQARPGQIAGMPVVAMLETPFAGYNGVTKRLTDVILATLILIALAPVLLVIAALVKLTSPGPAVFRQRRYGLDGEEIIVYKFRSMWVTEDGDSIRQASRSDDRVTPFGAILRRTSLDELPQLINVLQGRMSLVGPRPHAVAHNEQYRKLIKGYMLRHKVLPGITGLAQVNGCRGETSTLADMQARVTYDLEYLRHWSPLLDLKILALTALVLLGDKKAY